MTALGVLLVSLVGSLVLTPVVIRAAEGWGLYDHPDGERRVHTRPVPRVGGVVVFLAMLLGLIGAAAAGLEQAPPARDRKAVRTERREVGAGHM